MARGCLQRVAAIRPSTVTSSGRNRNMKPATNTQSLNTGNFRQVSHSETVLLVCIKCTYLESSKAERADRLVLLVPPLPLSVVGEELVLLRRLWTLLKLLLNLPVNWSAAHSPTLMTELGENIYL